MMAQVPGFRNEDVAAQMWLSGGNTLAQIIAMDTDGPQWVPGLTECQNGRLLVLASRMRGQRDLKKSADGVFVG